MMDQSRGWRWRFVTTTVLITAILVLTHLSIQALALNLTVLYLRDLSLSPPYLLSSDRLAAHRKGFLLANRLLARLPSTRQTEVQMLWLSARVARQLESRGESSGEVGCAWNPAVCRQSDDNTRLYDHGHGQIAEAYAAGQIQVHIPLERELVAYSCLRALEQTTSIDAGRACLERIATAWSEMAPLAKRTGVYVARYVSELTLMSSAYLGRLMDKKVLTCRDALGFLRGWIGVDGFNVAQVEGARIAAQHCPDVPELQFYHARAADLAGFWAQARDAYEKAAPAFHPEVAFWQIDFLARSGDCAGAIASSQAYLQTWPEAGNGLQLSTGLRTCCTEQAGCPSVITSRSCANRLLVFEAQDLYSRFAESDIRLHDNIVEDMSASGGLARRSQRFATFVAFGPYTQLPYGRYRVTFYIKAEGPVPRGKLAKIDVRVDYADWRLYFWSGEVVTSQVTGASYKAFTHEFTHTGEGYASVAVLSLTDDPVWVDRVDVEDVSCR